jgi:hypothetical protein
MLLRPPPFLEPRPLVGNGEEIFDDVRLAEEEGGTELGLDFDDEDDILRMKNSILSLKSRKKRIIGTENWRLNLNWRRTRTSWPPPSC